MRLMAIDYGTKRVGIASTDESGTFALPRIVIPNNEKMLQEILKIKDEEGVEKIIIGESLTYEGKENPVMEGVRNLKANLEVFGIEVVLHPEVLTTREARQIQGNSGLTDASAASLILKSYLDSK